jgi:hypothetical protein
MPNSHQHVSLTIRGDKVLAHYYYNHKQAYKVLPHLPLGKSDHDSVCTAYCLQAKAQTGR